MANDDGVVTRAASKHPAIPNMVLNVADNGALGDGSERENVADHQGGFFTAEDELAGVHALGGDK